MPTKHLLICVHRGFKLNDMLADYTIPVTYSSKLGEDVHVPATFRLELLDFIADQLPSWRDCPRREQATAETILTSQLCNYLSGIARHSDGWDLLQFQVEAPDEQNKGRKIDLVAAPCGTTIWIDGRRHTDFDTLIPIECKRLPTPEGKRRDEREYVFSRHSSTGGIHRFKEGHHGAAHSLAGMIGYIQENTAKHWHERIKGWISELVNSDEHGWASSDRLRMKSDDRKRRLAILCSRHERNQLPPIELRHLWLEMI